MTAQEYWNEHFDAVHRYWNQHRPQYQVAVTMEYRKESIILHTTINKHEARILVDSGATMNYIDRGFVRKHQLSYKQTQEWASIVGFDGETISEGYKQKIKDAMVRSDRYRASIIFDLAPLNIECYDAIVRIDWLKRFNPIIDWNKGMISIDREELKTNKFTEIIARTKEKTGYRTKPKTKELYNKELAKVIKKLPKKYHKYIELFVKKEYQISIHPLEYKATIKLKPGA
jgi:hypothetical protein